MHEDQKIVLFQSKNIRRIWHEDQWFYSVVDVVAALTNSLNPRDYWYKLKIRTKSQSEFELSTICLRLKLSSKDGKKRITDCACTKDILRIIQSIPSKKAEPFKQWLAQLGHERLEEIQDPSLAQERMKKLYEQNG